MLLHACRQACKNAEPPALGETRGDSRSSGVSRRANSGARPSRHPFLLQADGSLGEELGTAFVMDPEPFAAAHVGQALLAQASAMALRDPSLSAPHVAAGETRNSVVKDFGHCSGPCQQGARRVSMIDGLVARLGHGVRGLVFLELWPLSRCGLSRHRADCKQRLGSLRDGEPLHMGAWAAMSLLP